MLLRASLVSINGSSGERENTSGSMPTTPSTWFSHCVRKATIDYNFPAFGNSPPQPAIDSGISLRVAPDD